MKKSSQGFTLLEILLVLAIVALLASSGLAGYQQRVTNFKVEQTAQQMQAILEAAQAYHLNPPPQSTQSWPICDKAGMTGCSTPSQLDFSTFMPGEPLHNSPWNPPTTQSYVALLPGQVSSCITTGAPSNYYSLSLSIPAAQSNASQIAQMIASRLPSAIVPAACPTTVIASAIPITVPPSPGSGNPAVTSAQIFRLCPTGSTDPACAVGDLSSVVSHLPSLSLNPCPTGQFQKVYFMPAELLDLKEDLGQESPTTIPTTIPPTIPPTTTLQAFYEDSSGNKLNPVCFMTTQASITPNTYTRSSGGGGFHQAKRTRFIALESCVISCGSTEAVSTASNISSNNTKSSTNFLY